MSGYCSLSCGNKEIVSISSLSFLLAHFPFFFLFLPTSAFLLSTPSLSLSPSLLHTHRVKLINHIVKDWPLWECLNLRLGARVAHQRCLVFVLKAHHQGIFTWRAQIPIIPTWKKGRKGYTQRNSPRTIKGYNNRYFQGTKLQVIFRLRPLEGQNTTIVSIYISAVWLHCHWGKLCVFVQEE